MAGVTQETLRTLDRLTQLQQLTPRGRKNILALLDLLDAEYGVTLAQQQANMFISHLAATFRRMDQGECVDQMADMAAGQIRSFEGSGIVDQMVRDFSRITGIRFPQEEEQYFKMYLSSLLSCDRED